MELCLKNGWMLSFICILVMNATSCEQNNIDSIYLAYEELSCKYSRDMDHILIEVLEKQNETNHSLAKQQIQLLERTILLRKKELKAIKQIDSLIMLNILNRDCHIDALSVELKEQYSRENRKDSLVLKRNDKEFIKMDLCRLEDEAKVLELRKILSKESNEKGDNIMIKHKVNIDIKGKNITDTLYYVSFNNGTYTNLNRNIFLEN